MAQSIVWTSERIISDTLGCAPEVQIGADAQEWRLCRWRQFIGKYELPPLPDPLFTVHIGGKPLKTWDRGGWSEVTSSPGSASNVPADQPTAWLVDGELDVVTLSLGAGLLRDSVARDRFRQMRFAFHDPFGVTLTRQILGELYAPASTERDNYVGALVNALQAHILRGSTTPPSSDIPTSDFSAYRLHQAIHAIQEHPDNAHRLEDLAGRAGVTPSHFCRIFKRATGVSPHQYVTKARIERAQHLLMHSNLSLAGIAEQLGFTSQSHFTRTFRQVAGRTPSDCRRRPQDRPQERQQDRPH